MALNGTGIEFGKSEHDSRWRISRATTTSADFIVLGQRCGVQVFPQKVGHTTRLGPLRGTVGPALGANSTQINILSRFGSLSLQHITAGRLGSETTD